MKIERVLCFNMVELSLAIAILAIGIMSMLAILPEMLNRNSMPSYEYYATTEASNIQAYLANSSGEIESIPEKKNNGESVDPDSVIGPSGWDCRISGTDFYVLNAGNGDYGISCQTGVDTDFTGEMFIWRNKNPVVMSRIAGGPLKTTMAGGADSLSGVNIEISWPAEKPYAKRKKNYYYFEMYNFGLQQ